MPATIDAVAQFAAEAARFRDWARDGTDSGELAVRNALVRVMTLYLAALELPPEWSDELDDAPDAKGISDDERRAIGRSIAARLPFSDYACVFDPFVFPPEEPVAGPISDDIADIYREVVGGLIEYEAGRIGDDMPPTRCMHCTLGSQKTHLSNSTQRPNQALQPTADRLGKLRR
jgi:hypothetical protein